MVLVSVLMPMRNASKYVTEAVHSVLQETQTDLELIVINDHSDDDSESLVSNIRDPRIRLLQSSRRGCAEALNVGLAAAQGTFITGCDADDLLAEHSINDRAEWLLSHPSFGIVCGQTQAMSENGKVIVNLDDRAPSREITEDLRQGIVATPFVTHMIRREIFDKVGLFRPFFISGQDIDMQLRMATITRVWYNANLVYRYRLHQRSITHRQDNAQREFFENQAKLFHMQRRQTGQDDLMRGHPPLVPESRTYKKNSATKQMQGFLIGASWQKFNDDDARASFRLATQALCTKPFGVAGWRNLLALTIKTTIRKLY